MRIIIDQERCEGHGQCVAAAPEVFAFDDDGLTVVLQDPVDATAEDAARAAVRRCPVAALQIEEQG
jgi:ferredoxin